MKDDLNLSIAITEKDKQHLNSLYFKYTNFKASEMNTYEGEEAIKETLFNMFLALLKEYKNKS